MKKLALTDLNLPTLAPNRRHEFDFVLDDAFFAAFDQALILGGNLTAHLNMERTERLMTLDFQIDGTVRLTCDRSLDEFDQPISTHETLIVRFGDKNEELADNVVQITSDTQVLPLAEHLFGFVATAVPMKKLHPRFVEADAAADAATGAAAELAETRLIYSAATDADAHAQDEPPTDPRWNVLRHLN
ncbi:MAG: DUF177 domain-containing protein [Hymenobacteraceae bacterium]|nr:DUF177 domain-containing protein [Hymenobacteraceae bacterium]